MQLKANTITGFECAKIIKKGEDNLFLELQFDDLMSFYKGLGSIH